jgi:predicted RNA polymerase sigma factor
VPGDDAHRAIQTVFQIEWPRLVAWLARLTRDVGLTEELAQDALVAALEAWPSTGVPERPGAWLMATARNRALDRWRRERRLDVRREENARDLAER